MNSEFPVRDPELAALLREQPPHDTLDDQHRAALQARIRAAAAALPPAAQELPRLPSRRAPGRWRRAALLLPLAAAASLALFVALPTMRPLQDAMPVPSLASIDDLMDADVSEAEFRALLAGAADADELLLLVAAEDGE